MGKTVQHVASHQSDLSALLWSLTVVVISCVGWLFYTLYAAFR